MVQVPRRKPGPLAQNQRLHKVVAVMEPSL